MRVINNVVIMTLAAGILTAPPPVRAQRSGDAPASKAGWFTLMSKAQLDRDYGRVELHSVEFLNRHVGWVVGTAPKSTIIFRTRDGGRTWERLPLLDGEDHGHILSAVRFADANNGWIAGRSELLHTIDGGETWEPVDVTGTEGRIWAKTMLCFGPGSLMIGAIHNTVYVTTDAGATWTHAKIPAPGSTDVNGLAFVPPQTFFAVTGTDYGNHGGIYRSVDGGTTWEAVEEAKKPLYALAFHDDRNGIAAGEGLVLWTDDGGATWHRVIAPGIRSAARYLDEKTIVAVGMRPSLAMSTDGGRTWRAANGPNTDYKVTDIAAVDGGWWFATGGYGANELYQYVDPDFEAPIVQTTIPLPVSVRLPDQKTLPAGTYRARLAYRAPNEVLHLERIGEPPVDTSGWRSHSDSGAAGQLGSAPSATIVLARWHAPTPGWIPVTSAGVTLSRISIPLEAEYHKEDLAAGTDIGRRYRLSVEPTATGVAIVLDAAITPPRSMMIALAAAAVPAQAEDKSPLSKAGTIVDRARDLKKNGVRGININPKEASERVKAARSAPPALYRLKVRLPLQIFRGDSVRAKPAGT